MNVLKILRKSNFSLVMAMLIMFVSCEQYDVETLQTKVDYSLYKELKSMKINFNSLHTTSKSTNAELSMDIENSVNDLFDTNIGLPNDFHSIHSYDGDLMLSEAKQKGWLDQEKENNLRVFHNDLINYGIDQAVANHEQRILNANLNEEELSRETLFLNTIKYLDDEGVFSEEGNKITGGWAMSFS